MMVLKFGGTSVGTPERIKEIIKILKEYYTQGEKFAVVFSAFGGVTDTLQQMGKLAAKGDLAYQDYFERFQTRHLEATVSLLKENGADYDKVLDTLRENHEVLKNLLYGIFLVREASLRTMDYVMSFGERNAAFIISHALVSNGINASYLDARKIIKTNKAFGNAQVNLELTYKNIWDYFSQKTDIQVVTGFLAATKGGLTTTLGRGGSDYTASLIAAGLNAKVIEIWTDVSGVLTADPRKVSKAFTIPRMTYAEAMEMAHFGAKVIYPPSLQPALRKRIPLYIKNTFNPLFRGTYISDQPDQEGKVVKGISSISNIALLTLQGSGLFGMPGIAGKLFTALALANINVILITQGSSEHSISFAVDPQKAVKAKRSVEEAFELEISSGSIEPIKVEENLSTVAVIGENMRYQPGIAARVFQALGKNGINIVAIAQGSSELNISVVISNEDESKALNALHEAFFLSDRKMLNLFIVGVGLIGGTLLEQIAGKQMKLNENDLIEMNVVGLANSKRMLFNKEGIELVNWKEKLIESGTEMDISAFVERMKQLNLSNSILIDNTASLEVANCYDQVLDASISISTPNKVAASSPFVRYQRLKNIAKKRGVHFLYETNVGAGLPVISTIMDLMNSGDRILKIEGVLSGSLSFIFNAYNQGASFGEAVRQAMGAGYTEPDPRVDLSGQDVRKKLLILGREFGLSLENEDILIESFLPEESVVAKNVEDFLGTLDLIEKQLDTYKEELRDGKKLCFVASVDHTKKAKIGLEVVDAANPFFSLSGSDNMIVITSERYADRPLVVRGPGAGAEVTAAGVLAEIVKIGHYI